MPHLSANVNKDHTISLYQGATKVLRGTVQDIANYLSGDSAPKPRVKKDRPKSRAARWGDACSAAVAALETLTELQEEFEAWKDNLPENLQQSTLGEKLEAVCDLDLSSALEAVQEAESADLPMGFGRD